MKVKPATLLLIACAVWSIAGVNILRIGLAAYPAYLGVLNIVLSLVVFCIFQLFVFRKAGAQAQRAHRRVPGRATVLPQIL